MGRERDMLLVYNDRAIFGEEEDEGSVSNLGY